MMETSIELNKCELCDKFVDQGEGHYVSCGHFHCRNCIRMMIRLSSEFRVQCSVTNCNAFLDDEEISSLVSPEVFQEFLERTFNRKRKQEGGDTGTDGQSSEPKIRRNEWPDVPTAMVPVPVIPTTMVPLPTSMVSTTMVPTNMDPFTMVPTTMDPTTMVPTAVVPAELLEETPDDEEDMASGFGQITATTKFLIAAGYSQEEALRYLETESVLLTIKPITCGICLDEDVQPGNGIIIKNCLHMLCRNCLINYINLTELAEVECPCADGDTKCHEVLLPLEIRELCSRETYEKIYVDLSLKTAQEYGGMGHCMTPNCAYFCELEQETRYRCPFCHQDNCYRCNLQHTGLTCDEYTEKLKRDQEAADFDARNKLIQKQNERLNQTAIEHGRSAGTFRPCPKCNVLIEKNYGCDHMICTKCHHSYNWSDVSPKRLAAAAKKRKSSTTTSTTTNTG